MTDSLINSADNSLTKNKIIPVIVIHLLVNGIWSTIKSEFATTIKCECLELLFLRLFHAYFNLNPETSLFWFGKLLDYTRLSSKALFEALCYFSRVLRRDTENIMTIPYICVIRFHSLLSTQSYNTTSPSSILVHPQHMSENFLDWWSKLSPNFPLRISDVHHTK